MKTKLLTIITILLSLFLTGCAEDKPIVSNTASGDGYNIRFSVSNEHLESGGSIILTVAITDAIGNLVENEEEAVLFCCNVAGADIEDEKCDIKNGVASTIMKWEDDSDDDTQEPSKTAIVSASYRGALSQLIISFTAESF